MSRPISPSVLTLASTAATAGLLILKDQQPPGEDNTYGLPDGRPIKQRLIRFFRQQMRAVLGTLPTVGIPAHLPDLLDWNDPMKEAMVPLISAYWQESGQRTMERIGLDPDEWRVTNPNTEAKIQQAAMNFCQATNATTRMDLETALAELKRELVQGLVDEGEALPQLTQRVKGVFQDAEDWRAERIAASEASRAVHAAQEQSAADSGVVAGFELLISGDACPLCQMVAAECRRVRIGQPFAVIGHHPDYSTIRHPPIHPMCQCAMVEVLLPQYGGPENPGWDQTLIQPKPGPDYSPPEGKRVPKPQPRKLERRRRKIDPDQPLAGILDVRSES